MGGLRLQSLKLFGATLALLTVTFLFQNCADLPAGFRSESGNPYEGLSGDNEVPPTGGGDGQSGGQMPSCLSPITKDHQTLNGMDPTGVIQSITFGRDADNKEWVVIMYREGNSIRCMVLSLETAALDANGVWTLNVDRVIADEVLVRMEYLRNELGRVSNARVILMGSGGQVRIEDLQNGSK